MFDLLSIVGKIRAGLGALGIRPSAPGYEESVEQFVRRNLVRTTTFCHTWRCAAARPGIHSPPTALLPRATRSLSASLSPSAAASMR